MVILQSSKAFDLRTLLLGEEDWSFLPEVVFRSAIMFIVTLVALRLIGRRGIMQGVFELVTIITLGSAAGDPMFYKKVGLLPAILVFIMIVLMYRATNYLTARNKKFEHIIEGRHVRLIKNGRLMVENFRHEEINKDEIMSDLRMQGVSHLGQVEAAYIEASGEMSIFFFADKDVMHGLPIRPELYENQHERISKSGYWSCAYCGNTKKLTPLNRHVCDVCEKTKWVEAAANKRIE
jgi:uncharacterized membrane protein YcaP (DUF421 family)